MMDEALSGNFYPHVLEIENVLKEMHNSPAGAHFAVMKTLQRVRKRFYCIMAREDVEDWC